MDPTFIRINRNANDTASAVARGLTLLREGTNTVISARAQLQTMMSGDGTDESHFQMAVDRQIYPTLTDAKRSWDNLKDLADTGFETIGKIMASCAMHGV